MSQAKHDKQLDYIEFSSHDLDATKAFYGRVFGWRFTDWGPSYVSFDDGRMTGGFSLTEAPITPGGPLVVIYTKDLEQTEADIVAAGGQINKSIFSFPGGRRFHFLDPSGNQLAVWSE